MVRVRTLAAAVVCYDRIIKVGPNAVWDALKFLISPGFGATVVLILSPHTLVAAED